MKKFVALCSMVIALTFVVGCSPKAEKPAAPAAESHEGHNHGTEAAPAGTDAPAEKPAE